jgi:EAL domain-containing protein (putative c-di-GMP-specific phosphodiesterase class I)
VVGVSSGQNTLSRVMLRSAVAGAAIALCAVGGAYHLARQSDVAAADAARAALQSTISDFRALFGNGNEVDPRFIRMIEQGVGIDDARFEAEPTTGREAQPVVNAQGRILGFVTWQPNRPLTQIVGRLAPWLTGLALSLLMLAGFLFLQSRRSVSTPAEIVPEAKSAALDALPAVDAGDIEARFIRDELPRALEARALAVHYQPIVTAAGGSIAGVEALLRWNHQERGGISPAKFVPVAEQMGLMDELGNFVLQRALDDARNWPHLYISVNLSPLQVRNRGIVDVVRQALARSGIAPERLMLEITEGVLIDNPEEMLRRMEELRALGVRIALDDFGSGYSSLGYLQRFPFDKLKIDRSFVTPLGKSANAAVIVQAIVALGRALGVSIVVEGVETEEQRVLLRLAGCDEMQGFLFARPAPCETIVRLIASSGPAMSAA